VPRRYQKQLLIFTRKETMNEIELGPQRIQAIGEFVEIRENQETHAACMYHKPTNTLLKRYSAVAGLEEGAWAAMVSYAEKAVKLQAVDWETDDIDFLFPSNNFTERFLDSVGFGEKSIEEVSSALMEKMMRREMEK